MATQYLQQSSSGKEHLLGIAILVAFLLPHSNTLFQLMNPLMCLLLVYSFNSRRWKPYVLMVVIPIFLSLLINVQVATQKAYLSAFTILLYFFCFPFVGKVRVRNIYLYICLGYIVVSQLVYLLGIPFLTNFFDRAYPISEDDLNYFQHMQSTITYDAIFNYRLGGIYHNANNCAEFLNMLLAFFLVTNQNMKNRGVLIFAGIAYTGILLTGSRTGFVVASIILYFGLLRQKSYKGTVRFVFLAIAIVGLGYIVGSGTALRGFDVQSGMRNSANVKWDTFIFYLTNEPSIMSLMLGHFDSSLFEGQYGRSIMGYFDCEYGDLVFRFGIIGFLSIMLFWWKTAKRINKSCRFFFLILLWIISSSIVAAFRTLFIFLLLLSAIYSNYNVNEKHKTLRDTARR